MELWSRLLNFKKWTFFPPTHTFCSMMAQTLRHKTRTFGLQLSQLNLKKRMVSDQFCGLYEADSGNDFRVPEIGSDNSCFSFILFLYPHVVPSHSSKWPSFLRADFCFWSWPGLTRNENAKSHIKVVPTLPVYPWSPRTLIPGPHPTHISLPLSSPYPQPPLSTSNYFFPSHSWQIQH